MENQTGNAVTDTRDLSVSESSNDQYGKIKINNNVIAVIAHETAQKVQGVVELHGSLTDGLAEIIGKKPKDRGIRIEKEGDEFLTIDLSVVIEFGVNIPEVCVKVQGAVKKAIESMTGQKIFAVNIVVQGIRSKNEDVNKELNWK